MLRAPDPAPPSCARAPLRDVHGRDAHARASDRGGCLGRPRMEGRRIGVRAGGARPPPRLKAVNAGAIAASLPRSASTIFVVPAAPLEVRLEPSFGHPRMKLAVSEARVRRRFVLGSGARGDTEQEEGDDAMSNAAVGARAAMANERGVQFKTSARPNIARHPLGSAIRASSRPFA